MIGSKLSIRIALVAFASLGGACLDGERECYPTDWRGCTCADGAPGYQQCDAAGDAYGACDCSGTIPALSSGATTGSGAGASGGSDGGSGGAPSKAYLEECTTNEECVTELCYPFMAKGPHCSQPCGGDGDCPPPSPGCNMMGICKVP